MLDSIFLVYDHLVSVPDLTIFQQASSLQAMGMAREYIAREHALVIGALSDKRLTAPETAAFTEYAASRRFLHSRGMAGLDVALRRPYEQIFATEPFLSFATMEARVVKTGTPPPTATPGTRPSTGSPRASTSSARAPPAPWRPVRRRPPPPPWSRSPSRAVSG